MIFSLLSLAAGTLLLYFGAENLVRGASALARGVGLSAATVGLTVVAFGTSLPELVVTATAGVRGDGAIALGNVIGSNISNIGLVLGAAALVRPLIVDRTMVRREVPMNIGALILAVALGSDGELGRGDGAILLGAFSVFLLWNLTAMRGAAPHPPVEGGPKAPTKTESSLRVGLGLAMVLLGGDLMVDGAVGIAEYIGLSHAVVGLTLVAVGTSLPELATSLVAVFRREDDIGVGNVLGSNLFNILLILGVASLLMPIRVETTFSAVQFPILGLFTLALAPALSKRKGMGRKCGAILFSGYVAYVVFLFATRG